MFDAKPASVPLAAHFVLNKEQCPQTKSDIDAMKKVPYAIAIGSVMYLMVSSRPGPVHWKALKWLLRYLKHTSKYGLCDSKCDEGVTLTGFVDSNYANDRDKRKSTTSYVFTVCKSCISWKSQLQHIVALSTTESEYIAITEAMTEAVWLKEVFSELKIGACPREKTSVILPAVVRLVGGLRQKALLDKWVSPSGLWRQPGGSQNASELLFFGAEGLPCRL
ncbi:secreted RxLR effector protein 161-like [Salvia splendens]|uniref:secreted RxLR effector protein 161-like n=1 Tax=Salvia splendens TaxID=180675 RepID=UPI001C25277C|nr:secreted RxLR effector protein 161-like [Salvia splendens]